MLRALPAQLGAAIAAKPEDPVFRRLFPPAYANDANAEEEYRNMVRPDLDEARALALDTLAKTADATELIGASSSTPGCGRSTTSGCGWAPCSTSARTSLTRARRPGPPALLPADGVAGARRLGYIRGRLMDIDLALEHFRQNHRSVLATRRARRPPPALSGRPRRRK